MTYLKYKIQIVSTLALIAFATGCAPSEPYEGINYKWKPPEMCNNFFSYGEAIETLDAISDGRKSVDSEEVRLQVLSIECYSAISRSQESGSSLICDVNNGGKKIEIKSFVDVCARIYKDTATKETQ